MVPAAMAEFQLVCSSAERETEKLVAETDAEDGDFADELADVLLRVRHRLRITRTVRQQYTIEVLGEDLARRCLRRKHRHLATVLRELAQDVALHTVVINGDTPLWGAGVLTGERIRLF